MALQVAGLPISVQAAGLPMSVQVAGLPISVQVAGLAMSVQVAGLPMSVQVAGLPMLLQKNIGIKQRQFQYKFIQLIIFVLPYFIATCPVGMRYVPRYSIAISAFAKH
jgi:hypothetical protein